MSDTDTPTLEDRRRTDKSRPTRENTGRDGGRPGDEHGDKHGEEPGERSDGEDKPQDADGDGRGKPSPFKKTWVRVLLVACVVAALVAGGLWFHRYWTHGRFVQSTNNAYLQADQVTVSAKVPGTVVEVFVTDNQQVLAGDPLVRIDDSTNRARVQQALAQAEQARAMIVQYQGQIDEQRAQIVQARAAVDGAEDQRRHSQGEVDRYGPLAQTGAEPAEQLTQRLANRDQALSTLRQNEAGALQAQRRMATLSAQIAAARAQVAQAEAQALQAQIDVDSSLVRASIDGRVGDRQVRPGLEAQVGTRLLTLVPVQDLYLVANFKETQIGLMRAGQPATISVDALDGMELSGTVDSFSPATGATFALIPANNATGNFTKIVQRVPVRIRVDAQGEARKVLVPGLSVEVAVDTLRKRDDVQRREAEAEADQPRRERQTEQGVERDRQQPASGPGR